MQAVIVRQPGGIEQLALEEVSDPELGPEQVRVQVRATALNRADLLQRRGLYPPPPGASDLLGLECSGVVTQVGPKAAPDWLGQRVMALLPGGGYATQVAVDERHLLPLPERLSFEQGAAIPEAFLTASEALFHVGNLSRGEHCVIQAAAGGVGSAAVQLAHAEGALAIAVAGSSAKLDLARRLGATETVNYQEESYAARTLQCTGGKGASVLLDFIGPRQSQEAFQCLAPRGRWLVVGLLGGPKGEVDFSKILTRRLQLLGVVMRSESSQSKGEIVQRFRERFWERLNAGELVPVVDSVFDLAEVQQAHQRMESNANLGKIVLRVPGS